MVDAAVNEGGVEVKDQQIQRAVCEGDHGCGGPKTGDVGRVDERGKFVQQLPVAVGCGLEQLEEAGEEQQTGSGAEQWKQQ